MSEIPAILRLGDSAVLAIYSDGLGVRIAPDGSASAYDVGEASAASGGNASARDVCLVPNKCLLLLLPDRQLGGRARQPIEALGKLRLALSLPLQGAAKDALAPLLRFKP